MPTVEASWSTQTVNCHIVKYLSLATLDMGDNVIKIMVIGDIGVGKSAIIRQYVESAFSPEYKISVSLDFAQKQVMCGDKKVDVQLWDVPGHERFGGMTRFKKNWRAFRPIFKEK